MSDHKEEFIRKMKRFLHEIDGNAGEYSNPEYHANVRVPMKWPASFDQSVLTLSITQALTKQVYDLRSRGINEFIWIDFELGKLVIAFSDAQEAMLFKLAQGGDL